MRSLIVTLLKDHHIIPLKIDHTDLVSFEVRGELFISKKKFENLKKAGVFVYTSACSAAGGIVNSTPSGCGSLEAIVYELIPNLQNKFFQVSEHVKALELLHNLGFRTTFKSGYFMNTVFEVMNYFKHKNKKKDLALPYEVDGIVIKVNSLKVREYLGTTSKYPLHFVAFKFSSKLVTT